MTTATFKHIDPKSYTSSTEPFQKPWAKVDGPYTSFTLADYTRPVISVRGEEAQFTDVNRSGFAVYNSPAHEKSFTDDSAVRNGYYAEVESLLRSKLPGVKKVVIFDHTIRRHDKSSPRQPVQQVHVDQTPSAAAARVRRHLPSDEAEQLLQESRYQLINVWRPIGHPATDFPLAVIDWRSTSPEDFVKVDLLYPTRETANGAQTNGVNGQSHHDDDDDRGKEVLPDPASGQSTTGYQVKGETYGIKANEKHRFHYVKDMTPDEAMFIKCFDSRGNNIGGEKGRADCTPHTAFIDPETPANTPGRQSIEVRCLVFYE